MGVPRVYRKSKQNVIATYDFFDIADGTGKVNFNGYQYKNDSGTSYAITTESPFATEVETKTMITGHDPTEVKSLDLDFDLATFNLTKIVRGTANIEMGYHIDATPDPVEVYFKFVIKKWDGSSETVIGTGITQTIAVNGTTESGVVVLPVTCTRTTFGAGDTLRLTVEGWAWVGGGESPATFFVIGHDPKERDGTYITPSSDSSTTTKLIATIPFEIDV